MAQSRLVVIAAAAVEAFAGAVEAAFQGAARVAGLERVYCRIAGTTICFEVIGPGPRALTRALAHRACAPAPADLTVRVFEANLPQPPWEWTRLEGRGVIATADPAWCASYQDDVLSLWHRDSPVAWVWLRDARRTSLTQHGSPFLHLLHAWTASRGWAVLHASCAAGVLFVGPGGAGKSSSALTCARAGLPYLADDYCLARDTHLESLYCSAKVFAHDLKEPAALQEPGGKALVWVSPVPELRLRAIAVPERTGAADAALHPISPARALLAVAPSTMYQLPWSGADTLRMLSDLVRRVPCYRLTLGARDDVPRLLASLA